jgi:hypothetical protein
MKKVMEETLSYSGSWRERVDEKMDIILTF